MDKEIDKLYKRLIEKPFVIAGPCVIESEDVLFKVAEEILRISKSLDINIVFKASFDKANRTSIDSFRGSGLEEGKRILKKVKDKFGLKLTTDIHEPYQAKEVAEVVDIIQIPAFLCRQTDLLVAAAETGKIINIKKAQFLSGKDMIYPVKKVLASGNDKIMLTERGNAYGNNDLVVDFRNILEMKKLGYPVVMDVTHSCQKPGGESGKSGGNREYALPFSKAAAAVGVRGFFFETHPNPAKALSDGPNMIPLSDFENTLKKTFEHVL